MGKLGLLFFSGFLLIQGRAAAQLRLVAVSDTFRREFSVRVLPQNFYNQHLSFFCKKEQQLQKLTSLPLFIRAGSKAYVDYLEKKPNAVWLPKQ
jgi:hypothetical protein